jgi:hypothetical protein
MDRERLGYETVSNLDVDVNALVQKIIALRTEQEGDYMIVIQAVHTGDATFNTWSWWWKPSMREEDIHK